MSIESCGGIIFCIRNYPRYGKRCTCACNFLTGVGQEYRPQTFPLKVGINSKSSDKRHRHGITGQFLRQRFRQIGTTDAACAQGKKTG